MTILERLGIASLSRELPILIAGPTASGKSALALEIADRHGGRIINADALQVYADWRVLTARPSAADCARVPHALYGHVPGDTPYSVGQWLRDLRRELASERPVIVGGTGLYFSALTEGLADIPPTPPDIRDRADERLLREGPDALLAELDAETVARIDRLNPMRVQRAWEVQAATGKGLAYWHKTTGPPLIDLTKSHALVLNAPPEWLNPRIVQRTSAMLTGGALEEARENRATWGPDLPSAKAIGAAALMAYLDGQIDLDETANRIVILTRQYAKRQRTWFRTRMTAWNWHDAH
ncbi:MAG: tRNA (adenosine(37)-N6)-dimethylallyltransferase MiaA [Pseudomonadota bacterium]